MNAVLPVVLVAAALSGCAGRTISPPVPELAHTLQREVVLVDERLGDISDIWIRPAEDGSVESVILAGSFGIAFLGADLSLSDIIAHEPPRIRDFNPMFVDLDGDGQPELLRRGNSVFFAPLVARGLRGGGSDAGRAGLWARAALATRHSLRARSNSSVRERSMGRY